LGCRTNRPSFISRVTMLVMVILADDGYSDLRAIRRRRPPLTIIAMETPEPGR
jgi:hypothetical protein